MKRVVMALAFLFPGLVDFSKNTLPVGMPNDA